MRVRTPRPSRSGGSCPGTSGASASPLPTVRQRRGPPREEEQEQRHQPCRGRAPKVQPPLPRPRVFVVFEGGLDHMLTTGFHVKLGLPKTVPHYYSVFDDFIVIAAIMRPDHAAVANVAMTLI